MKKIKTGFKGLYIIQSRIFKDNRGLFIKTYNQSLFQAIGLDLVIKERYFSLSKKNVIRGMHFQTPPYHHIKLVNVIQGTILDVVLDLRTNSTTYGQYFSIKLYGSKILYIPKGFAHGFLSLEDNTIVEYNQTSEYAPNHDDGIKFDSFGIDWGIDKPIVSERDLSFSVFTDYKSPF